MNRNLKALELDKVLNMLSEYTACEEARECVENLRPAKNLKEAKWILRQTDDAYILTAKFGAPSFYGLKSPVNAVTRAAAGAVLGLGELLRVDASLKSIRSVSSWRSKSEGMETTLDDMFSSLAPNKFLEDRINSTVQSEEEVYDHASPELANIRRKIRGAAQKAKEQLDKMIRSSTYQKYLQDNLVTQRDGRYVVPVRSEYRAEIPGLVHDSSSSGATLFIEPMAVVEANNEIRVLKMKEHDEIERILTVLSAEIGEFAEGIKDSYNILVDLNVVFAKAQLAFKMKAVKPIIEEDGKIKLNRARHPLIASDKVVPTDIELGYNFDSLVITGPNTGGKTVSIKTLGLMCLMAMCGLMIPCGDNSKVAYFKEILVDIGDEQSIEQSLSTFSSHMTNIISILEICSETSLVLVDELGAGTDPVEGAALATAIIEEIRLKGAKLAATTHYAELKEYALKTAGVENGCCEFDVTTLSPTYKLLIGVPGKSNAFAISKKLGMSEYIVDRAKALVSEESKKFETVLSKLDENRRTMEAQNEELKKAKSAAQTELKKAEEIRARVEKEMQSELEMAKFEASQTVAKTRAQAEALITELDEIRKNKNKLLTAEDKAKLKAGIRNLDNGADIVRERTNDNYELPRPLKIGDDVTIFDIDKKAVVLELSGEQVLVQAGIIKTRVKMSNLRLITDKKKDTKVNFRGHRTVTKTVSSSPISMSCDVRGQNSDEAIISVDSYIDRALRQNLSHITIIHGKGTGVLRVAVQTYLKRNPHIKSYRLGTFGEGDSGVTIAEIK